MYIYKICNKINDKLYIGQTKETLEQRFKRHMTYQKDQCDTKFYRAVRKYKPENFFIVLIEEVENEDLLNEREEFWIKELNTIDKGYNTALGKIGGDTLSKNPNLPKIKEKISKALKGKNNGNASKVKALNIFTKELLHFDCMKDCQEYFNIKAHAIIDRRCRKVTLSPYKGWMFYYENDLIEGEETIENTSK